jgi:16S rRNA (cytosine967-C5)-methyltransferase
LANRKHLNKSAVMPIKSQNPRQVSFSILNQYFSEKSNLKFLLNDSLNKQSLSDLDRRFVYEVVKGTVRYVIRIDFLISLFSNKKVESVDRHVLNILRLAIYQLLYMDKTPAYAAINESVEIAKRQIGAYSSKFVNAVLRKIASVQGLKDFLNSSIENAYIVPAQRLSVMYSYPGWLSEYWIRSFGIERTEHLFRSLNCEPHIFIRVNRLKTDKIKLLSSFEEAGMIQGHDFFSEPFKNIETADTYETDVSSNGNISPGSIDKISAGDAEDTVGTGCFNKTGLFDECIILKSVQNIEKIPGYFQGHFSVQDFSSQFAVKYFLNPDRLDKILDICGAPGGKATYMAELTDDKAEIVSVDINIKKMDLLLENISRLGISNISFVNADAAQADFLRQDRLENYFDKIFIDAPCSALGTISKNPDAKYACNPDDLERLAEITGKILSSADKYLKPGGIIIFYKCTLSEVENQSSVKKFIEQNPGKYRICHTFSDSNYIYDPKDDNKNLFFEIMPEYFSSEPGFICVLKKLI